MRLNALLFCLALATIAPAEPETSDAAGAEPSSVVRADLLAGVTVIDRYTVDVRLSEVNFRTMESRICPGLYFAGELLDIDGLTGGFNFQAAWTTGWLAGQALAAR